MVSCWFCKVFELLCWFLKSIFSFYNCSMRILHCFCEGFWGSTLVLCWLSEALYKSSMRVLHWFCKAFWGSLSVLWYSISSLSVLSHRLVRFCNFTKYFVRACRTRMIKSINSEALSQCTKIWHAHIASRMYCMNYLSKVGLTSQSAQNVPKATCTNLKCSSTQNRLRKENKSNHYGSYSLYELTDRWVP